MNTLSVLKIERFARHKNQKQGELLKSPLSISLGGINMSEKHSKISIFLFSVATFCLFGFFILTTSPAFAGKEFKGKDRQGEWQKPKEQAKEYQKHQGEMKRENLKQHQQQKRDLQKHQMEQKREVFKHGKEQNIHGRRDYPKRSDYHQHRGYRESPYDRHRQYQYHDYDRRRYEYHGHWRSWEQWDAYAKRYPHIYKHGTYYRENAHLMFRFCEPGTGNCIFFSIGR